MINIILTDQTIQISGKEEELKKIKNYETYNDQKTGFSKGGFDPRRIKHVSLMKEIKGRLVGFAGLTKEIVLFCKNNNIKIDKIEDKRTHFDFQEHRQNCFLRTILEFLNINAVQHLKLLKLHHFDPLH